jgi:NAD(P)-dependent dehydrogenase (short-subunit alcohol dehydrogenase family)
MELGLGGHTALITGGASGIGLATAHGFCQEGCSVILWDNSPRVEAVALELATLYGIEVKWKVVDVVEFESVRVAAESDFNRSQRLEHVVHCAAIGSSKFGFPFTNLKPDDWKRTLEVNIMGMVNVAHAVTPHLMKSKSGSIVFLASVAGQIGSQTDPPYSASKAANINFAQCMAKDLAGHGIRVNSVCPGMVKTPLNRSVWQSWNEQTAESERISYEQWAERKIRSVVPLGRWQTPEDIASMIVFLSSERASNVTGQTINVDGGFVMHC